MSPGRERVPRCPRSRCRPSGSLAASGPRRHSSPGCASTDVRARVADDRLPTARAVGVEPALALRRRTRCGAATGGRSPPPRTPPDRTAAGPRRCTRTRSTGRDPNSASRYVEMAHNGARVRGPLEAAHCGESTHSSWRRTVEPPASHRGRAPAYDPRGRAVRESIARDHTAKRRERHEVEPGDRPGPPAPAHRRHRARGGARGRRDRAVRPLQGQDRAAACWSG